jgi:hypothetical protein
MQGTELCTNPCLKGRRQGTVTGNELSRLLRGLKAPARNSSPEARMRKPTGSDPGQSPWFRGSGGVKANEAPSSFDAPAYRAGEYFPPAAASQ